MSPSQKPLPNKTQHSQEADIHPMVGFEPKNRSKQTPHTHALDCETTGIGTLMIKIVKLLFYPKPSNFLKGNSFLERFQASFVCFSRKSNTYMKMSMEHWRNDTDRGNPKHSQKKCGAVPIPNQKSGFH
jgi:hypothetical protein